MSLYDKILKEANEERELLGSHFWMPTEFRGNLCIDCGASDKDVPMKACEKKSYEKCIA